MQTSSFITLHDVSYILPTGTRLFQNLNAHLDSSCALVGNNGVGKTILAHLMAGHLPVSSGHINRSGKIHYLAQQIQTKSTATVAHIAGVWPVLQALARIKTGHVCTSDFDLAEGQWDLDVRLQSALNSNALSHLNINTPAHQLSGGEISKIALLAARLAGANFLIMDEPSNHLDAQTRLELVAQLKDWQHGLLLISHDRQLLRAMPNILELSELGLKRYGGNYDFFYEQKKLSKNMQLIN